MVLFARRINLAGNAGTVGGSTTTGPLARVAYLVAVQSYLRDDAARGQGTLTPENGPISGDRERTR